jgi:hypothetical protein
MEMGMEVGMEMEKGRDEMRREKREIRYILRKTATQAIYLGPFSICLYCLMFVH